MSSEIDELKAALEQVQSQLAFQEDTVQVLNEALAGQQQEILVLRRQLELLMQRLDEQAPGQESVANPSIVDEKPPHY